MDKRIVQKINDQMKHGKEYQERERNRRLDEAVIKGRRENRPLNKLRAYYDSKKGWCYKYIK